MYHPFVKNCNRVNGPVLKGNQIEMIRAVLFTPCKFLELFPVPRPYKSKQLIVDDVATAT